MNFHTDRGFYKTATAKVVSKLIFMENGKASLNGYWRSLVLFNMWDTYCIPLCFYSSKMNKSKENALVVM